MLRGIDPDRYASFRSSSRQVLAYSRRNTAIIYYSGKLTFVHSNYMFDKMSTRTNLCIIQIPKKAMLSKLNNGTIGDITFDCKCNRALTTYYSDADAKVIMIILTHQARHVTKHLT